MRFSAALLALSLIVSVATVEAGKPKPKPKIDTKIRAESNYVKEKPVFSKPDPSKTAYIKAPYDKPQQDPNKRKIIPKRKGDGLHRVPKDIRKRSHFSEGS